VRRVSAVIFTCWREGLLASSAAYTPPKSPPPPKAPPTPESPPPNDFGESGRARAQGEVSVSLPQVTHLSNSAPVSGSTAFAQRWAPTKHKNRSNVLIRASVRVTEDTLTLNITTDRKGHGPQNRDPYLINSFGPATGGPPQSPSGPPNVTGATDEIVLQSGLARRHAVLPVRQAPLGHDGPAGRDAADGTAVPSDVRNVLFERIEVDSEMPIGHMASSS